MRRARAIEDSSLLKASVMILWGCALAAAPTGCSPATRTRVLSAIFDGVPQPRAAAAEPAGPQARPGDQAPSPLVPRRDHGPYAAHLCGACHESAATNALILPPERLCVRCHELGLKGAYVHGPIASGGCLVCHDPHSSRYRALLVSESEGFCLHCHDRRAVAAVAGHERIETGCTDCHDAHSSDRKYLLK
jgi:predicted CXXCH cytochrome family protein